MARHFLGFDKPPVDQPDPEPEITTPDEIREAITHLAATARRMPDHWLDKRAAMHDRINVLLDLLDRA